MLISCFYNDIACYASDFSFILSYYPTQFYSNIPMSQQSSSSGSGSVTNRKTRNIRSPCSISQSTQSNSTQNNTNTNSGQMPSQTQLSLERFESSNILSRIVIYINL